ncbi:hypothetical protein V1514DRAFT_329584 [Lipomyces japonicus]|uniref:uncharacterized protein n=1 Tax=Lipomyces japonicus TaxID=56871 RepID=UPI0034CE067F
MTDFDTRRSAATAKWVDQTELPNQRPGSDRLPPTELTSSDELRDSTASAALRASLKSSPSATKKHAQFQDARTASIDSKTTATTHSNRPVTRSARSSQFTSKQSYRSSRPLVIANPQDLPSHPIVGVKLSASNLAANLARDVKVTPMWKPDGTSANAASAALLAASHSKSPEIWKPDPASREGLAKILQKDPKYTITSQTGSHTTAVSAKPHRYSTLAAQEKYPPGKPQHTPPLSPKLESEAVGAGKFAFSTSGREEFLTPPSPLDDEEQHFAASGAASSLARNASHGKSTRQYYAKSTGIPQTSIKSMAGLEHAAKKAADKRLSTLGKPEQIYTVSSHSSSAYRNKPQSGQSPVTALSGAENASRKIQLEQQRAHAQLNEFDRYDEVTRYQIVLAAAERNVNSRLGAIDKEISATTLWGNKEFNALALAAAEQEFKGKYTANAGKIDIGGGVYMSQDEVSKIAQRNVQPVLNEISEKALADRERDEQLREERERIKTEKAEEKARKREEKAEEKRVKKEEKDKKKEESKQQRLKELEDRKAKNEASAAAGHPPKERRLSQKFFKRLGSRKSAAAVTTGATSPTEAAQPISEIISSTASINSRVGQVGPGREEETKSTHEPAESLDEEPVIVEHDDVASNASNESQGIESTATGDREDETEAEDKNTIGQRNELLSRFVPIPLTQSTEDLRGSTSSNNYELALPNGIENGNQKDDFADEDDEYERQEREEEDEDGGIQVAERFNSVSPHDIQSIDIHPITFPTDDDDGTTVVDSSPQINGKSSTDHVNQIVTRDEKQVVY